MPTHRPTLSIVCPAYQEEEVLPLFHAGLSQALEPLGQDFVIEVLYVDDGSTDGTLGVLRHLGNDDPRVRYLSLSRNFGHQAALTAGLEHAIGDVVVSLDSDLQHPPALIPTLIERWREGHDVVLTIREDSSDQGWFKRASSRWFYRLLAQVSDTEVRAAASDFRLLSRPALDALLRLRETHRYLRGMVNWLGFRVSTVPFQVAPRAAGKSRYTLRRMLRLAADGMLSFSRAPLRLPLYLGAGAVGAGLLHALVLAGLAVAGASVTWLGNAILLTMLLLGGALLCSVGVLGEYVGRVYEEVKQRPLYLVKEGSATAHGAARGRAADEAHAA